MAVAPGKVFIGLAQMGAPIKRNRCVTGAIFVVDGGSAAST
jgi:hypothetical protein